MLIYRSQGLSRITKKFEKFFTIGKNSFISYGDMTEIDMLITDNQVKKGGLDAFRDSGVKVEVVNAEKNRGGKIE